MRIMRKAKIPLVLVVSILFGGCATIGNGSRMSVSINTDDPSSEIYVDGVKVGTGSFHGDIKRRGKTHPIEMKVDGRTVATDAFKMKTQPGFVVADVVGCFIPFVWWFAIPSLITDGATASWKKVLNPTVELKSK